MGLLTKDDFKSHLHSELVDEITRSNDELVARAINRAESEAKSYLNRYDIAAMFSEDFTDEFLKSLVLDIACWHLVKLANPNVNMEVARTAYEDAIKFLKDVQKGGPDPGWPLAADDEGTIIDDASNIEYSSNIKRSNHY